ncbi:MAG: MG2 domain-containing protein, partial [Bacteroidota bacterium]|nr:MG2 domain-containing protein [Bacteroidota bacterium]
PDVPLQPMQEYEAEISSLVLFDSGFDPDFASIDFRTPQFDAVKAEVFWTHVPHEYYTVSIQANLHFNYPVQPDQLRDFLEVRRDGETLADIQIVSEQPSEVIAVSIGTVQQQDQPQHITVVLREGLQSIIGREALKETREFETVLPPITQLAVTGVASGYDGSSGWIEVATTQMVDEEALRAHVHVEPAPGLSFFVSDNMFRIEGAFENAQTVELVIDKGLPGLFGGVLEQEYRQQVSFVDVAPAIHFSDRRGRYLMRGGEQNVEVRAVNIDEIEIEVQEVFANNVLHFLNQHRWFDYDYGYNPNYYVGDFGRELYRETVQLDAGRNWLGRHVINLDRVLESRHRGVYVLRVSSSESRWIQDSKIIALSDLALIARMGEDQVTVFVNSISSGLPVEGVDLTVVSDNNQTLLEGRSDHSGVAVFNDVRARSDGFTPRIVTAVHGEDFNYLDLEETRVETSRFDVGGLVQPARDMIAFMYAERDLYRPGETAHVSAIVRSEDLQVRSDIPVILKVLSPRGRSFREFRLVLNREGSFEQEIDIPDYALTGLYRLELYTGGDRLIGSSTLRVEEFAPDKIRVQLRSDERTYSPGDDVQVHVDAEYLFGAEASNLRYEADVQLRHRPYRSERFPAYDFSLSSVRDSRIDNVTMDGTLDATGEAELRYTVPADIRAGGILEGSMYVSVFDLTGRTVNRLQTFTVHVNDTYIGIRSPGTYFGVNKAIDFRLVAVDRRDRAVKDLPVDVRLVRLEWQTVLKKDNGNRYYYASEEKEVPVWEKRLRLRDETPYSVTVNRSGKYELRVGRAGSSAYQQTSFYAYGWATSTASSFEVDREGRIDIVFDKERYRPGETAKVLFMCPFAGRLLVTVERNGVFHHQYLDVEKRSVELKLPVRGEYLPNAFVTATLFRPHSGDRETPFLVGHGFASMTVERKENRLPVRIEAAEKVKPGSTQTITIKTAPQRNVYVTLAAVDEGILQITDYETPDPYDVMYARRALQVSAHDLYRILLPEIAVPSSSTGGGDDMLEEAA